MGPLRELPASARAGGWAQGCRTQRGWGKVSMDLKRRMGGGDGDHTSAWAGRTSFRKGGKGKPAGSKALGLGMEGQTLSRVLQGNREWGLAQPFLHWPRRTGQDC